MPTKSRTAHEPLSARQMREFLDSGVAPDGVVPSYWDSAVDFAAYVRSLRERRGWTTREAAERMGKSQAYVSNLENAERKRPPSLGVVRDLANLYDVNLRSVLIGAGFRFDLPATMQAEVDIDVRFARLMGDSRLAPPGYRPEYEKLLSTEVKRFVVEVAVRAAGLARSGVAVEDVLARKDVGRNA